MTMDTLATSPDTHDWPDWALALRCTHFAALGMEVSSAQEGLSRLLTTDSINLACVTRCLDLLRSEPCLLHLGAPVALMSYSPALQRYRACFDGSIDVEPTLMDAPQAGLWLTLVAAEAPLPQQAGDWGLIRLQRHPSGRIDLIGLDALSIEVYQAYADVLDTTEVDPDRYDAWISRAVWTCVRHAMGTGDLPPV